MSVDGGQKFPIGTPVSTADGIALGTVVAATANYLVVERGRFVRHGYVFRHAEVDRYEDGTVVLHLTAAAVEARFGHT